MNWLKQIDPNHIVNLAFLAFVIIWFTRSTC